MFERLTQTAVRTLFFARQETSELGGTSIEPEHLLLALLRADKGPIPHVLGVVAELSYTDARAKVRAYWSERQQVPTSVDLPLSDQTQRILDFATEEADRASLRYVGAGHLLLGLLREESSFAAGLLRSRGMTIERLREHLSKPPVVPEPDPLPPPEGGGLLLIPEAFDAIVALERIRYLAEEIGRPEAPEAARRLWVDEIHYLLDALKRHLA